MTPADLGRPGPWRRHAVLGCAALATLVASVWALDDSTDDATVPTPRVAAAPATPVSRAAARADAGAVLVLALPERDSFKAQRLNLFASSSAAPASAPAAVAVAVMASAPAPAASVPVVAPAPPINVPFTYGGRLVTEAGPSVLLNEGASTRVLAVGASLGEFRFEQDGGSQLVFIHVPSGERVVLALQP